MRVCLQRAPLYCTQQSQCKPIWQEQTDRATHQQSTKRILLWTTIMKRPQNQHICGIRARFYPFIHKSWPFVDKLKFVAAILYELWPTQWKWPGLAGKWLARNKFSGKHWKVTPMARWCRPHCSAARHWNMKKLCPGKAKFFRWSDCRSLADYKKMKNGHDFGKNVTKRTLKEANGHVLRKMWTDALWKEKQSELKPS